MAATTKSPENKGGPISHLQLIGINNLLWSARRNMEKGEANHSVNTRKSVVSIMTQILDEHVDKLFEDADGGARDYEKRAKDARLRQEAKARLYVGAAEMRETAEAVAEKRGFKIEVLRQRQFQMNDFARAAFLLVMFDKGASEIYLNSALRIMDTTPGLTTRPLRDKLLADYKELTDGVEKAEEINLCIEEL